MSEIVNPYGTYRPDEIEWVIDRAYQDWIETAGLENKKCKHPSRAEYDKLFRQVFPWAGAVLKVVENKQTGEVHDGK